MCLGRYVSILLLLSPGISGCATLSRGTTQKIPVTSVPEGADVAVGTFRARTPMVIELKRGESHVVRISMEGYKTEIVTIGKIITPAVSGTNPLRGIQEGMVAGQVGGLAAGGPVAGAQGGGLGALAGFTGVAIDAESGALYRLHPERIHVVLEPGQPGEVNDSRLKEIELLKSQGILSEEEAATLRRRLIEGQK